MDETVTLPTAAQKKSLRRVRLALGLSLAANLLVAGLVVGAIAAGGGIKARGIGMAPGLGMLNEGLSLQERKALRAQLRGQIDGFRQDRAAMQQDFLALAKVLQAPLWDRAEAQSILTRTAERGAERISAGREVVLDYLQGLTPQARAAIGARLAVRLNAAGDTP